MSWIPNRTGRQLRAIRRRGESLAGETTAQLQRRMRALQYRSRCGDSLPALLPETCAAVREVASRVLNMRHYDVQVRGGIALSRRCVAEMGTGEGKTLTATLPLVLHALNGRGAHLVTANDYLARRDAELMRPLYEALGLSVGVVQAGMPAAERRRAYAADVTYATAQELGFDFLRDELARSVHATASAVQREPHYALVDEADSLLIDAAGVPLIVSAAPDDAKSEKTAATFCWAAEVAARFAEDRHYIYDAQRRRVDLTSAGRRLARGLPDAPASQGLNATALSDAIERALLVNRNFRRDEHYIVRDGRVVIVDEATGRAAEGRQWRDGVHQAIEAREQLTVTLNARRAAQVTMQSLFARYPAMAGMTGTAAPAAREFRRVYGLRFVRIPTHRPCRRRRLPARVFRTAADKWAAIVGEVRDVCAQGRPVLIGTRSVEKSEHFSELLSAAKVPHEVLNARQHEREAAIVAQAGQPGRVTVATNMAGRGTDIALGPGVSERGGLHVVISEMHESARIDRQLAGRCARQGDPGTFRQFLSHEDELLREGFGGTMPSRFARNLRAFRRVQRRIERRHFSARHSLWRQSKEHADRQRRMGQSPFVDGVS